VAGVALTRLRIVVVGVIAVALAVAAGRIFDRFEPIILLGAVLPAVASLVVVTLGRPWWHHVVAAGLAVLASLVLAVAFSGGHLPGDVVDAVGRGVSRLLSTEWPSPRTADLVGTVTLWVAVATAVAAGLACATRSHLAPLVPLLVAFVAVAAASAPAGAAVASLVVAGASALVLAAFGGDTPPRERARALAGERRLLPILAFAAAVGVAAASGLTMTGRADPRTDDPPADQFAALDPIEAVKALRAIEPAIDLYEVGIDGSGPRPARWRTAAADTFDGEQWRTAVTLRPIGRRLGPGSERTRDVELEFRTDDLDLLPLPGAAVTVAGAVETDAGRQLVRTAERPAPGSRLAATADVMAAPTDAGQAPVATRPVDQWAAELTPAARGLITPGTVVDQLTGLAEVMRTEWALDPDAPGAGVQQALIERFVRDTRRGSAEQFVGAFVLMARSLGVDARVASGFVIPEDQLDADGAIALRSDMAAVWPEVRIEGFGWVPFDPVPPEEASDLAPPAPPPLRQSPVAPQPPVVPPVESPNEPPEPDEADEDTAGGVWDDVLRWVGRGALAVGIVALPLAAAAGVIIVLKRRRRRRLLGARTSQERARGAWAVVSDLLVDSGMTIDRAWTDHRVAEEAETVTGGAGTELRGLASLSSAATFGPGFDADPTPYALACVDVVERAVLEPRSRRSRLRCRLSTRSLRRRTGSPITAAVDRRPTAPSPVPAFAAPDPAGH
jgi:transglutaminase-like putative cysteine protease